MGRPSAVRRKLLQWYENTHRKLPWRETSDPYAIWISEIMLQQTRVAAVIPYYQRFLDRFPSPDALASAPEEDLLAAWSGLGYYSRAHNLQKAARQMGGRFPQEYESIRALAGVGDYTAAAIASIAFGLPYAAVDGNALRVLSRLTNDAGEIGSPVTRRRLQSAAGALLDREQPGRFNQAIMELGATVCLPKRPQCLVCPVAEHCEARRQGTQTELPVKIRRSKSVKIARTLLLVRKNGCLLMWRRPEGSRKLGGFWELPEPEHVPDAVQVERIGRFRHSIMNHDYTFEVVECDISKTPDGVCWIDVNILQKLLLSTTTRKALALLSSRNT